MADHGQDHRDPKVWWAAARTALEAALETVDASGLGAIAVDGTSGTMLPVDDEGRPLASGRMYNDTTEDLAILASVAEHAPETSAAHGPTSGLAKALAMQSLHPAMVLHQADWIACRLSNRMVSDANNALKTGYDPVAGCWPDWIAATGLDTSLLPPVVDPSAPVGRVRPDIAEHFGLSRDCLVIAGTTDGCASFLATGASEPGDGVTALGTTMTLKILSDRPIFSPKYGIYSHRVLGLWLAGGASNSGGAALLAHFAPTEIERLSEAIDPDVDTGLDYYPLPRPGERFPIADATLAPRMTPVPDSRAEFLKGMFEGIAAIETLAYKRLVELGAPRLASVRSVGGGAANAAWTRIRERRLNVPLIAPFSDEAAFGTALLARRGYGL